MVNEQAARDNGKEINDKSDETRRGAQKSQPGSAGDTPSDSVIENPREVAPGDNTPGDTAPTRSG